ncbi:MAG: hypothetical protein JXA71_17250 [Chitinispirillaceae bacterium]|nr:hypothetical protein [Chitinispirillaceae bacterium]
MQPKDQKVVLLLVALCGFSVAGDVQGNYYGDANKELFVMPKSSAMGGSDMSLLRSAQPMSNPANLNLDSASEVALSYAGFYQNTFSTSGLSYLGSINRHSSFSLSMSYLLVPGIELNNDTVITGVRTASASELYFRAGYGRTIWQFPRGINLLVGVAVNGLRKNLINETGYGIGIDIGTSLFFTEHGVAVTSIIENATTSYTYWNSAYKEFAWPHARIGFGWYREIPYLYGRISASYLSPDLFSNEGVNTWITDTMPIGDGSTIDELIFRSPDRKRISKNPSLAALGRYGAEYSVMNRLAFRAGLNLATMNFSFGAGLCLLQEKAGIDFAYLTHELAPTYKLSVHYRWH